MNGPDNQHPAKRSRERAWNAESQQMSENDDLLPIRPFANHPCDVEPDCGRPDGHRPPSAVIYPCPHCDQAGCGECRDTGHRYVNITSRVPRDNVAGR